MTKFTQGEWKCHNNEFNEIRIGAAIYRYNICILPDYSFLSSTPQKDKEEQKANARLIASAPEMYNWIKYFLRHAGITANNGVADECRLHGDIREAVALIARIDGEECHDKTNLDC